MKAAVAGIPGAWSSERLAASLRMEGFDEAFVFSPADTLHSLATASVATASVAGTSVAAGRVTLGERDLSLLDAIVVKKLPQSSAWSRLHLHALRALEGAGVRVFSRPDVIDIAMDRYRMTMVLAAAGLPVPQSIATHSPEAMRAAVLALGDVVVKPVYTSKGRGMFRADPAQIARVVDGLDATQPYIVQRFVASPGRDIGATVIGGRFVGAFYRVARDGEWMTTTAQGGRYRPCDLDDAGVALAERAAAAFGLDYTVVDLVEHDGGFLIYEVSAFGGFRGLLEATGVDPSVAYARYVVSEARR